MKNSKSKIQYSSITVFLFIFLFPTAAFSAGLVPCGGPGEPTCEICHLFELIDSVLDFLILKILFPLSIFLLILAGLMFALYPEDPGKAEQAKKLILAVVIGLFIIFSSYLIVGLFLKTVGLAGITQQWYQNWWEKGVFEIKCSNP